MGCWHAIPSVRLALPPSRLSRSALRANVPTLALCALPRRYLAARLRFRLHRRIQRRLHGPSSLGHLLHEMSNPYSCWLGCFRCEHYTQCAEYNAAGSCLPSGRIRRLVTIIFTCNMCSYSGFVCGSQLPRPSASSMGTSALVGSFSRPRTARNAGGPGSLITIWMVHGLLTMSDASALIV